MLSVNLYKNFRKRSNSTKVPSASDTYDPYTNISLKDRSNILNPILDFHITSGDPASLGYNYAYIQDFGRYYYIDDWTFDMGLWIAHMTVDPLASFKTDIGNLSKYVVRSASQSTPDISDGQYPVTTSANQVNTAVTGEFNLVGGFYILGLVGAQQAGVPAIGGINYYYMTPSQMLEFTSYLTGSAFNSLMNNSSEGVTEAISKMVVNPIEYVASCMYFPCSINMPTPATYVQPKIGWWDTYPLVPSAQSQTLGGQISSMVKSVTGMTDVTFTLPDHPQVARGTYMNRAPYSIHLFHLDPFGDIEIPSEFMFKNSTDKTCKYTVHLDLLTGQARINIRNNDGTIILAEEYTQVGVPIQLSQISTDMVGLAAGFGRTLWDGFKGIFDESIANIGSAILNGLEAMHTKAHEVGNGSGSVIPFEAITNIKGPVLRTIQLIAVDEDLAELGRPLYKVKTLNTLSGFIKCADEENDIACLEAEKAVINSALTGGFFYE